MTPESTSFDEACLKKSVDELQESIGGGLLDKFLEMLLGSMRFFFIVDKDYRRNIEDFEGSYAFESRDGAIGASAVFADSKMEVFDHKIEDANVTVTFKDGEAMKLFLLGGGNVDVISAVLHNDVTTEGNLNYLGKFAYMAKNLSQKFELDLDIGK